MEVKSKKKGLRSVLNVDAKKRKFVLEQLKEFTSINDGRFKIRKQDLYLCINDKTETTNFDSHYIYHPAWAARVIKVFNPSKHVDIGSTLHFCSMLSAFVNTEFYDYRPAQLKLTNLTSGHADLVNLPFKDNSIESLSCMHTIEHIGLGRYGDPIDSKADLKAIQELKRVCAKNGSLLIVVPIGIRRIQFNAHRIYAPFDIVDYMKGFKLNQFSFVNDIGEFIENTVPEIASNENYACGCYWFVKL